MLVQVVGRSGKEIIKGGVQVSEDVSVWSSLFSSKCRASGVFGCD